MTLTLTEELPSEDKIPLNMDRIEFIDRIVVPTLRQKFGEFVSNQASISIDGNVITVRLDTDEDLKKELKLCQHHGIVTYAALQHYRERVSYFESLSIWGMIKLALKR